MAPKTPEIQNGYGQVKVTRDFSTSNDRELCTFFNLIDLHK
jgi:hypothetical protein